MFKLCEIRWCINMHHVMTENVILTMLATFSKGMDQL